MGQTGFIYGLYSNNNEIKYVGKSVNPKSRLSGHKSEVNQKWATCPKTNWLREELGKGNQICYLILEEVPVAEMTEAEQFWIGYFKMLGAQLTNVRHTNRKGNIKLAKPTTPIVKVVLTEQEKRIRDMIDNRIIQMYHEDCRRFGVKL